MQSPSSLQLLPLHIIESVVDYVVGSPRSSFFEGEPSDKDKDTYEDTRRQVIMPLLWVCRNFRTIVYSRFCKVYTLELNMISNVVSAQRSSWPQCMRMIEYPTHHLSKELVLRLDQWTIFNGKMREALLNSRFSGFSFPNAQLLTLDFIPGKINCSTKAEGMTIESNIIAFAELLWQMAPEATEIKLTGQFFLGQVRKTDKLRFIDTIFQLHQYYNRIGQKSNFVDGFAKVLKSKISDVVYLECRLNGGTPSRIHLSEDNHERLLQLAQQSAATLQSLSLYVGKVKDATGIILRSDRSRVQYPCLHTLKLYGKQIESNTRVRHGQRPPQPPPSAKVAQLPVFPGMAPFPVLQCLSVDIDHPFGDDTLFRENAATLECLYLKVYPATLDVIRNHAIFTSNSHPKLQLVRIDLMPDPRARLFTSLEEQMQFVLNIAPNALVRRIDGQISTIVLPIFADFACIRVLSLPNMYVSFWDTVALIKSLPLLSDLRTSTPSFGFQHADVKLDRLPSFVVQEYAPLSSRFCRWYFEGEGHSEGVAKCVLLLALLCPKLEHLNPAYYHDDVSMAAMRNLYSQPGFEPFAARLWQLASR